MSRKMFGKINRVKTMKKYSSKFNWNALSAFGGYSYNKASVNNNKESRTGKNRGKGGKSSILGRAGLTLGKAELIKGHQAENKKDKDIAHRNARREDLE